MEKEESIEKNTNEDQTEIEESKSEIRDPDPPAHYQTGLCWSQITPRPSNYRSG